MKSQRPQAKFKLTPKQAERKRRRRLDRQERQYIQDVALTSFELRRALPDMNWTEATRVAEIMVARANAKEQA